MNMAVNISLSNNFDGGGPGQGVNMPLSQCSPKTARVSKYCLNVGGMDLFAIYLHAADLANIEVDKEILSFLLEKLVFESAEHSIDPLGGHFS